MTHIILDKPIRLDIETKKRLKEFGKKGETYRDIINHLLDLCEND